MLRGLSLALGLLAAAGSPGPVLAQAFPQAQKLLVNGQQGDRLGWSVAIDGNTAVIGAPFHNEDVSGQGAAWIFARDPATGSWSERKRLTASDFGTNNHFGTSVAIDGDTVLVGAPGNDIVFDVDQGSAYVFERNAGGANQWGEVREIFCPDAVACATDVGPVGAFGAAFGGAVAIDGDRIVIGAPGVDVPETDGGAGYVFERDQGGAGSWGLVAALRGGAGTGEFGGASVAIHGDTVVMGIPSPGSGLGSAKVFQRDQGGSGVWGLVKLLQPASSPPDYFVERFGTSVAIEGDTLVVGAQSSEVGDNSSQGSAHVFERNLGGTGNWGESKRLTAADGADLSFFGAAVAIAGDHIAVGAPEGGLATTRAGRAYVLERDLGGAGNWGLLDELTASDRGTGDLFGFALDLSGSTLLIGAQGDDIGAGANVDRGSAYVFGSFRPRPLDVLVDRASSLELELASFGDAAGVAGGASARVDGDDSASSNGVSVSHLSVDAAGSVSADVETACGASDASFTLSLFADGELIVEDVVTLLVGPSAAPVLTLQPGISLPKPNHKYRDLATGQMLASASDDCDGNLAASVVVEQVTSDEADDLPGDADGVTTGDIAIPACASLRLRAERVETGNGRVYGITLRVRDSEGNTTRAIFPVSVPISQNGVAAANAATQTLTSGCP
jgi:hypothetical protein